MPTYPTPEDRIRGMMQESHQDELDRTRHNLEVTRNEARALKGEIKALKRTLDDKVAEHRKELADKDKTIDRYHQEWMAAVREARRHLRSV